MNIYSVFYSSNNSTILKENDMYEFLFQLFIQFGKVGIAIIVLALDFYLAKLSCELFF